MTTAEILHREIEALPEDKKQELLQVVRKMSVGARPQNIDMKEWIKDFRKAAGVVDLSNYVPMTKDEIYERD